MPLVNGRLMLPRMAAILFPCIMDEKGCETMIISSSAVGLSSNRTYSNFVCSEKETLTMRKDDAVALQLSEDGRSMLERLRDYKDEDKQQQKSSMLLAVNIAQKTSETSGISGKVSDSYELKIKLIKRMLEALKNGRYGRFERLEDELENYDSTTSYETGGGISFGISETLSQSSSLSLSASLSSGETAGASSVRSDETDGSEASPLVRVTASQTMFSELEAVSFAGSGVVNTSDGRQINFNVELGLSRAFCAKYEDFTMQDYVFTDPLVINFDTDSAQISDQKFLFDIDADGDEEEISMLGSGSGFLALDKNGDGIINDGSELFGARTGNGFADLAGYDGDGNGWIDEADSVFQSLKVWSFDEDGNPRLTDLKEAGIGAVYLGSASTEYHLNDNANNTQAVIRSTGVFLRENGGTGTIQHVDFAV